MKLVGLDLGSVYTKAALLDPDGRVLETFYEKRAGSGQTIAPFLAAIGSRCPGEPFRLGVTGVDRPGENAPPAHFANPIVAIASGVGAICPQARCVVEIGGHTSKLAVVERAAGRTVIRDFATNDACAAGTGSFLEQQAKRMNLGVEDLSSLSHSAARDATIAGRCAVFAKSDMIHLQQKGTPTEEIAYGLCMAICRNASLTLLRGRQIEPPIVIAGGCARNRGIVRAFRELLGIGDQRLVVSPRPGLEGAIGAALEAGRTASPAVDLAGLGRLVETVFSLRAAEVSPSLPRLVRQEAVVRSAEPERPHDEALEGYLGVDVGSVSTDLVVTAADGEILSAIYLPTRGQPVEAVQSGLAELARRFRGGLRVRGCGTTGSGRHLAAKLLGADVVKNEITCQLLGARKYFENADTILEIGGQDSKFIIARDGQVADFAMNKICAAGTGSFLEEQSREMGIDVFRDFARCAFRSTAPRDLGSRCTVFMETEIVNALQTGAPVDDICGGLAYAIVNNYLEKVVGNRPLGRSIVFQGGVASNDAVVAAFGQVLGQPIQVHPYNRISGAIGAAIAASQRPDAGRPSRFKGLAAGPKPSLRSFECKQCSNRCEVNVIETPGEKFFFGDTCEKYTSSGAAATPAGAIPNLADEYHSRCERFFSAADSRGIPTVGVPRASTLIGHLPFWGTFFSSLGFHPVLSASTSQETLSLGLKHLSVGVCLPIKLMAGHAGALIEQGVDFVFTPSVVIFPGDVPSRSYACPYTMAVPYMIHTERTCRRLVPPVYLTSADSFTEHFASCARTLGVSLVEIRQAYETASQVQTEFDASFRERVESVWKSRPARHVFAVLGKPYNTFDSYLNLNLFERLRKLGVLAIPLNYLPVDSSGAKSDLPWRLSADIHRAAQALASVGEIFPITISNFGCGPDAFTFKQIGEALQGRPNLILEFDEHRGEAGLITRLEAFVDQIESGHHRRRAEGSRTAPREEALARPTSALPPRGARIRLPYFADHAYAFSGLWKSQGYDAQVLPLPDDSIRQLGEKYSLGKECHPYTMIAGDLINLHRTNPGEEITFFFPNSAVPCLLQQYGKGMQILLRELGIESLKVSSPTGDQQLAVFGIEPCERFYVGLLAIELLVKAVCEVRPYETKKGTTDAIHRQNLLRIEAAIVQGDVLAALDESLKLMSSVEVDRSEPRPIVGVTGDIYTKANPAANRDLFRWFEDQGLEVWPSPFQIDYLDFGISRRVRQSLARRNLSSFLVDASIALRTTIDAWRVWYTVGDRVSRQEEPGYEEMRSLAAPYMPIDAHEILFLNIAKIVDYARHGADGIINAVCFNCMVGNAAAAIIEKVRRDHHDIPIVTAVYSGGEDPSRKMVLEAFVSQVKAFHRARQQAGAAGQASGAG